MTTKTKVFVYGSLKRGYGNHALLTDEDFLKEARTKAEYTLVSLGSFPGVLDRGDTAIAGEVYDVSQETLRRLDILEGHPTFYRRTEIEVEGESVSIYLLQGADRTNKVVEGGVW